MLCCKAKLAKVHRSNGCMKNLSHNDKYLYFINYLLQHTVQLVFKQITSLAQHENKLCTCHNSSGPLTWLNSDYDSPASKKCTSQTLSIRKRRNKTHCNLPDSMNKLSKPQFIQPVLHWINKTYLTNCDGHIQ